MKPQFKPIHLLAFIAAILITSIIFYTFNKKPQFVYADNPVWLGYLKSMEGKITEQPGAVVHPWIKSAYELCGLPESMHDDNQTSWCSAGLNKVLDMCGLVGTRDARAKSWMNWGGAIHTPKQGAVCVFKGTFYHATVLYNEKPHEMNGESYYQCIGCNQKDTIRVSNYRVSELIAMRWPTKSEVKNE
jgi:uncharacterized protein (TIGR02594 family)